MRPAAMMFEVHLGEGQHFNGATLTARTTTLANALDFIGEFYEGPLLLAWVERDGSYSAEVYDWIDRWFDDPPVRARVITPRGHKPPDCRIWCRGGYAEGQAPAVGR